MAKKVRRVRKTKKKKQDARTTTPVEEAEESIVARKNGGEEEFKKEYGYVLKDLRRVFVLALVLFVLLIALNLLLG